MTEFTFWDVQHGSASYIRTPNNKHIVIDLGDGVTGTEESKFSPLSSLWYEHNIRTVDYLIVTHPHRDHIDDIANLNSFQLTTFERPRWLTEEEVRAGNRPQDADKLARYFDFNRRYDAQVPQSDLLQIPQNWGNVRFKTFSTPSASRANLNNHSLVTLVEYEGLKALIPGDNESESWRLLLEQDDFRHSLSSVDILVASHHGRQNGYCADLFVNGLLNPRLTIISDSRFGDTSATGLYGAKTRGWLVHYPDGTSEERKCVTTRCDGRIHVKFGRNASNNFIEVRTEKGSASFIK